MRHILVAGDEETIEVQVRFRDLGGANGDPVPWRAEICNTPGGAEHLGRGATPQEALINAALRWADSDRIKRGLRRRL